MIPPKHNFKLSPDHIENAYTIKAYRTLLYPVDCPLTIRLFLNPIIISHVLTSSAIYKAVQFTCSYNARLISCHSSPAQTDSDIPLSTKPNFRYMPTLLSRQVRTRLLRPLAFSRIPYCLTSSRPRPFI